MTRLLRVPNESKQPCNLLYTPNNLLIDAGQIRVASKLTLEESANMARDTDQTPYGLLLNGIRINFASSRATGLSIGSTRV